MSFLLLSTFSLKIYVLHFIKYVKFFISNIFYLRKTILRMKKKTALLYLNQHKNTLDERNDRAFYRKTMWLRARRAVRL